MSIAPRGMSIQEAYRLYREDKLVVNRKYQRKLVWTLEEKQKLVDSILADYPIPLVLLAEVQSPNGVFYEIIDGMQRLNAIVAFIENDFSVDDKYFDVDQFARARQTAEAGKFNRIESASYLTPALCANYLDYQLAVTTFPTVSEAQVTEVFGRINSGGQQLSWQDRRQAGKINEFSQLIRRLASEVRGDASRELLPLSEMPDISIDTARRGLGYTLKAEEIFWCKQGILWTKQLRESEDEEILADICASLLEGQPIARSRELLDAIYDGNSPEHLEIELKLTAYGSERLYEEVKVTLSVLRETVETYSNAVNALRTAINPGSSNPIKASFFALFMAFHDLVIVEEKTPCEAEKILQSIGGLQKAMISTANYSKTEDRVKNIDKTKGLIQRYFVKKDPPMLRHGAGLALDFENAMRRSKIETGRYECKQGLVNLSADRKTDKEFELTLLQTICAIANVGPDSSGFLFLGVADKEADAKRVKVLDEVEAIKVGNRFVVGIDRELPILGISLETYVKRLSAMVTQSELSEILRHQVSSQIDTITYKGLSVIRLRIPPQKEVSFLGERAYIRDDSSTVEASGKKLLAISALF